MKWKIRKRSVQYGSTFWGKRSISSLGVAQPVAHKHCRQLCTFGEEVAFRHRRSVDLHNSLGFVLHSSLDSKSIEAEGIVGSRTEGCRSQDHGPTAFVQSILCRNTD